MRHLHAITIFCAVCQLVGCTRKDPSLVPLGHGPLSRAEHQSLAAESARKPSPPPESHSPATESPEDGSDFAVAARNQADKLDGGAKIDAASADAAAPEGSAARASQSSLDAWLGSYRGSDTTTFIMPEQPERRFDDKNAKIRVESAPPDRLWFSLVDSSNGKDICRLSAVAQGNTAVVEGGQSCFLDADESMTVKSRPGKATRQDRRLMFELKLDTTFDTEVGPLHGSIEYHFEGER